MGRLQLSAQPGSGGTSTLTSGCTSEVGFGDPRVLTPGEEGRPRPDAEAGPYESGDARDTDTLQRLVEEVGSERPVYVLNLDPDAACNVLVMPDLEVVTSPRLRGRLLHEHDRGDGGRAGVVSRRG